MTIISILVGFVIGISLGAILSWRDDNYRKGGEIWCIYFVLGIVTATVLTLLNI